MAYPTGFEPATSRVGVSRAIQLCHGQIFCTLDIITQNLYFFNKITNKKDLNEDYKYMRKNSKNNGNIFQKRLDKAKWMWYNIFVAKAKQVR